MAFRPDAAITGGVASSSLLVRTLKDVAAGARDGWRRPGLRRGRWLLALLAGAAVCFGVVAAVTLVAKGMDDGPMGQWDRRVIAGAEDWPITFTDAIIFESPANIMILGPVTLLVAGWCFARRRTLDGLTVLLSYGTARLLIWTGWWLWSRSRPDSIEGGAAALAEHSFPSGHSILPFTTYGLIAYFWWRASPSAIDRVLAPLLLAALAAVVGLARVRMGAHWPSDVIAGWMIGVAWLATCVTALRLGNAGAPAATVRAT